MWPRLIEMLVGVWLLISPSLFAHPLENGGWWANDYGCALAIILLAGASWLTKTRLHLFEIPVGLWLLAFGYFAGPVENPPALQNDMITAIVLLTVAIVPNEASQPPIAWRRFLASHDARGASPSDP